ncbi:glycosyltransferase [Donghicola mangrovi]|uniref:Glycosyltransferase n=1 Tax=Donghicola mangrovi TaxID=2729614 RepID=A0A850QAW4_9RHOB|nr:glycosyltransferase [Donghicola mangrovi]NVO25472.1 glycosyltransferase [Donghicola mangrovi]
MNEHPTHKISDISYTWNMGAYEDGWIATAASMTLHRAKGLTASLWLPELDEARETKRVQFLLNGLLIHTAEIARGEISEVKIEFPDPVVGSANIEILSEYKEDAEGDARRLAFHCRSIDIDFLDGDGLASLEAGNSNVSGTTKRNKIINEKRKYFVFPDYRATNPYQKMIEQHLPESYDIRYSDIDGAVENLMASQIVAQHPATFHLHWSTSVIAPAENGPDANRRVTAFLTKLDSFIKLGGILIWTVHNTIPHDAKYLQAEVELNQGISDRAHRVHVHSRAALTQIEEYFSISPEKVLEIPHPSYVGVYPDYVSRESARRALGINQSVPTFVFFGQLRPYKGLSQLLASAKSLRIKGYEFHLIIVGNPVHPYTIGTVSQLAADMDNVTIIEKFVRDEEIQVYYRAADVAVFPYKSILTSGSVLGALSFDTPVIAPNFPAISELLKCGEIGWLYDRSAPGALTGAMEAALNEPSSYLKMADAAGKLSHSLNWGSFAQKLDGAIQLSSAKALKTRVNGQERVVFPILPHNRGTASEGTGVVILTYRELDDLRRLLETLNNSEEKDFRVYVVDNGSNNLFDYEFRELIDRYDFIIEIYRSHENLGYAAGNNIGICLAKEAGHEFVWILNPDTEVEPTAFGNLRSYALSTPDAHVIGPKILKNRKSRLVWSAGGQVKFAGGTRTDHLYNGMDEGVVPDTPYTVEYLTGASLFCRSKIFEEVGLFPEDYFLYFEETDWCLTVRHALGDVLHVCPSAILFHDKTSEKGNLPADYYFYYLIRNIVTFTRKFSPAHEVETIDYIKATFVSDWLERIKSRDPSRYVEYKKISEAALMDGEDGLTGPKWNFTVPERMSYGYYSGNLKATKGGKIFGSLTREDNGSAPISGVVLIDDQVISAVGNAANSHDIKSVDFEISGGAYLNDGLPHEIKLVSGLGEIIAETKYYVPHDFEYRSRIEGIRSMAIRGWVLNSTNFNEPVEIDVFEGDRYLASGSANQFRADLQQAGNGRGHNAFIIRLPLCVLDGKRRTLTIKLAATGQVLHKREVDCNPPAKSLHGNNFYQKEEWLFHHREARFDQKDSLVSSYIDARNINPIPIAEENIPKVSVIMPAYNRAETIVEAMISVFQQSYPDVELIVVDDGSSDDSAAIAISTAEEHGDGRCRVISLEKNCGVSHARNVGLENAQGNIIAYLDSDNTWQKNYLSVMIARILASGAQTAYCAQLIHQVRYDRDGSVSEPVVIRGGEFSLAQIENRNFIDLNCFVHSRNLFKLYGGFNEGMTRLVDWELILRYCRASKPIYVRALLSDYFMDKVSNQITRIEDHGSNLSILKQTINSAAPFILSNVQDSDIAAHLIIPISDRSSCNDTLVERFSGKSGVEKVTLIYVGESDQGLQDTYNKLGNSHFEVAKLESWELLSKMLVSDWTGEQTHIIFAQPNVIFEQNAIKFLCDASAGKSRASLALPTIMGPIGDHLRQRFSFAQGPLTFPQRPREYASKGPENQDYVFYTDRIQEYCFAMRYSCADTILNSMAPPSSWIDFCDQIESGIHQIGGDLLIDQRARMNLN